MLSSRRENSVVLFYYLCRLRVRVKDAFLANKLFIMFLI